MCTLRAFAIRLLLDFDACFEAFRVWHTSASAAVLHNLPLTPSLLQIIARQFDKHTEQMPHGIIELVDRISLFLSGCSLYHDEQLHLVEFAALEIKKLNDAMDMDLLVRKKPFREED